uniref:Uncharacterized protein n=1 Tax=viral metagenome TaxID=1070528 RepID=A0A6C0F2N5_9ZZZZ
MDNQFNTLMRSYHDNYLQFKLTGNTKYKIAYESAEQGLDAIVLAKNRAVQSDAQNIETTLGTDAENKMKDVKSQSVHLGQGLVDQNDEEVAAQMRNIATNDAPVSLTTQYIILGVLVATIAGLSFL